MPTLTTPKLSAEEEMLRELRKKIIAWRMRSGKSVYWMPKPLWEEAVAAAQLCGIKRAARGMGIDFEDLNNRVRRVEPADSDGPVAEEFVELPGVACATSESGSPSASATEPPIPAPAAHAEPVIVKNAADRGIEVRADVAVVEVTAIDGARMTVHVPICSLDLNTLVHNFGRRA